VRAALDTNVLAYAEGVDGRARRDVALELLRCLPQERAVLPVQVLGELFNVLIRRAGRSRHDARDSVLAWRDAFQLVETSPDVMLAAADLATDHRLGIWDAVVVAATSKVGCRVLLSEELQEGFTWAGVTVVNPFASARHPLLRTLLAAEFG
jgi:predicted nucleic acid-binding protein